MKVMYWRVFSHISCVVLFSILLTIYRPTAVLGNAPITSFGIYPDSVFPVELGQTVTWLFTPKNGAEYNVDSVISFDIDKKRAYRIQKTQCNGPLEEYFSCTHKTRNEISVTFKPTEEHFGFVISVTYYKDMDSLWAGGVPILYREVIQLTKQPTYVEMDIQLKEASRYTTGISTELRLEPPVFLTGSTARVDCKTDGSLPPAPIGFSIECPPPPIALVEHDRITQSKHSLSYEVFYRTYGFRSPPTLSDLAPYVARKNANELLRLGHVMHGMDNKTLRATLSITEIAHDCHVVCRVAGKETRRRLAVYHPTTTAFLLPRPRDGFMQVGSEIRCHADGYPPPMLSLRLTQPLRPPKPLTEEELETLQQVGRVPKFTNQDPITREYILANSGLDIIAQPANKQSDPNSASDPTALSSRTLYQSSHATPDRWRPGNGKEPYEEAGRLPGIGLSSIDRHRQLGLHSNEYNIQGATFSLAPNATPGIELLLTCTARNVLPGDTTFLGLNGTIARTRFVVSAVSYVSLGISLGVCACVIIILLIVIVAMLLQKRRQSQTSTGATTRLPANGMKKVEPKPRPQYTPLSKPAAQPISRPTSPSQMVIVPGPSVPSATHNTSDSVYDYDAVYNPSVPDVPVISAREHLLSKRNAQELQYVELSFDHMGPRSSTLRGGRTSASMTLFNNTAPRPHRPFARVHGASLPQGLDIADESHGPVFKPPDAQLDEASSHYTEIVAFMQPKAHSSQLVLQQQQEATQALLAMQQHKPRVFV